MTRGPTERLRARHRADRRIGAALVLFSQLVHAIDHPFGLLPVFLIAPFGSPLLEPR